MEKIILLVFATAAEETSVLSENEVDVSLTCTVVVVGGDVDAGLVVASSALCTARDWIDTAGVSCRRAYS